jgi:hypothetical protein
MGMRYAVQAAESKGLMLIGPIFSKIAATYAKVETENATTAKVADIDGLPSVFLIQNEDVLLVDSGINDSSAH